MSDLRAFLTARIDEDDAVAQACKWKQWVAGPGLHAASVETSEPQPGWYGERATVANLRATVGKDQREREHATHIARHDPARALREVAAKRRVLARHHDDGNGACDGCNYDQERGPHVKHIDECPELRDMALIYADHPDCVSAWREPLPD